MKNSVRCRLPVVFLFVLLVCLSVSAQEKTATILHTNDFHTAFDPIPAYWLEGSPRLGGAAHLAGLINQIREREKPVFLFDTGDMFTGQISFLTKGEALMEMMMSMKYDAMAIGNHEFDYGSDNFEKMIYRVPFPVLGANIFYKDSGRRYSRPYTILEKDGVRLGVIGIIGMDARSVALPSGVTNKEKENEEKKDDKKEEKPAESAPDKSEPAKKKEPEGSKGCAVTTRVKFKRGTSAQTFKCELDTNTGNDKHRYTLYAEAGQDLVITFKSTDASYDVTAPDGGGRYNNIYSPRLPIKLDKDGKWTVAVNLDKSSSSYGSYTINFEIK